MIKVAIIEDEDAPRDILMYLLETNHQDLSVVGSATTIAETLQVLNQQEVDLLFLDIKLEGTGEESLDLFTNADFQFINPIIITTAYSNKIEYYQKAFRSKFHVVDFLIKPIGEQALKEAIEKAKRYLETIGEYIIIESGRSKIPLFLDEIIYFEVEKINDKATGRTNVYCTDERILISEKSMIFYENKLNDLTTSESFFNTHDRLHNRNHVKKITQNTNSLGGFATMSNQVDLPIAINIFASYKKWLRFDSR